VLVIDRVKAITSGRLVVAIDGGEFIVRWLERRPGGRFLVTDKAEDAPILVGPETVFGVVTHVIHEVKRRRNTR